MEAKSYFIDPNLIRFIITNLVSNSVKYSPAGSSVNLELNNENDNIKIIVKDEGVGIPDFDKKNLFEPFHRGSNIGEIQGTGLGLSIVKKSVELHDGEINFISKEGKGTTFTVKIPQKVNHE